MSVYDETHPRVVENAGKTRTRNSYILLVETVDIRLRLYARIATAAYHVQRSNVVTKNRRIVSFFVMDDGYASFYFVNF